MKLKIRKPFRGVHRISFYFGESPSWYVNVMGYPHNGVDYAMPVGNNIVACDEGVISYADNTPDSDGLGINIKHNWGMSQYWHLSELLAREGATVGKNQMIGKSGMTGFATGAHLHFGIKVNGINIPGMRGWVNPLDYIEGDSQAEPPADITEKYYLVLPGDSLWKIAKKFYGKGEYWRKVYMLNKDKITDPGLIYPFQRLKIS